MIKNKESYQKYLLSDDWKEKRDLKRRTSNRCAICDARDALDVHHLNYRDWYDVEQSDLRVLCRTCHFLAHDLEKSGAIKYINESHHSRFVILKNAVKKAMGKTNVNLFYGTLPDILDD